MANRIYSLDGTMGREIISKCEVWNSLYGNNGKVCCTFHASFEKKKLSKTYDDEPCSQVNITSDYIGKYFMD